MMTVMEMLTLSLVCNSIQHSTMMMTVSVIKKCHRHSDLAITVNDATPCRTFIGMCTYYIQSFPRTDLGSCTYHRVLYTLTYQYSLHDIQPCFTPPKKKMWVTKFDQCNQDVNWTEKFEWNNFKIVLTTHRLAYLCRQCGASLDIKLARREVEQ